MPILVLAPTYPHSAVAAERSLLQLLDVIIITVPAFLSCVWMSLLACVEHVHVHVMCVFARCVPCHDVPARARWRQRALLCPSLSGEAGNPCPCADIFVIVPEYVGRHAGGASSGLFAHVRATSHASHYGASHTKSYSTCVVPQSAACVGGTMRPGIIAHLVLPYAICDVV